MWRKNQLNREIPSQLYEIIDSDKSEKIESQLKVETNTNEKALQEGNEKLHQLEEEIQKLQSSLKKESDLRSKIESDLEKIKSEKPAEITTTQVETLNIDESIEYVSIEENILDENGKVSTKYEI